jgi:hypothetical protein
MANCRASLSLSHFKVDLKDKKNIRESLYSLLSQDNDLTENEDYFRDDTLELGYESEADRIIQETIQEMGFPDNPEKFTEVADPVSDSL